MLPSVSSPAVSTADSDDGRQVLVRASSGGRKPSIPKGFVRPVSAVRTKTASLPIVSSPLAEPSQRLKQWMSGCKRPSTAQALYARSRSRKKVQISSDFEAELTKKVNKITGKDFPLPDPALPDPATLDPAISVWTEEDFERQYANFRDEKGFANEVQQQEEKYNKKKMPALKNYFGLHGRANFFLEMRDMIEDRKRREYSSDESQRNSMWRSMEGVWKGVGGVGQILEVGALEVGC